MDSPYRINNHKKKTLKQKPPIVTEDQSKNENIKPTTSKRYKNNVMKGGNISDIHTLTGREILDQTLQNDKVNSILENKREDNKKFITIAKRMIDNS